MSVQQQLTEFLIEAFSQEEWRRWIKHAYGDMVLAEIPSESAEAIRVFSDSLSMLRRKGELDRTFFDALLRERPKHRERIYNLECLWRQEAIDLSQDDSAVLLENDPSIIGSPIRAAVEQIVRCNSLLRKLPRESHERTPIQAELDDAVRYVRAKFAPQIGSYVAGARLERVIETGNFGTVWEAYDEALHSKVAVKIFRIERLAEGQMLHRFRRSISALKMLSNDDRLRKKTYARGRIVRFQKADISTLAFSMEFLPGGNLSIIDKLAWSRERKIEAVIDLCASVEYAHSNGIIHRDIKPGNVLLDHSGEVVLTDFDISDVPSVTSMSTTVEGTLGTPVFAAPEQLVHAHKIDVRVDVYSLGRLLLFLLLERSPGYAVEFDPSLIELSSEPLGLVEVIRKATQYDPARRYSSASEMLSALETCLGRPAFWRAKLNQFFRVVRKNWIAIASVLVVVAVLSVALVYQTYRAEHERRFREEAETARREANEAWLEAENLRIKIVLLSWRQKENMAAFSSYRDEKNRLESIIATRREELAGLRSGTVEHDKVSEQLRRNEEQLAEVDASVAELQRQQESLNAKLEEAQKPRARRNVDMVSPIVQEVLRDTPPSTHALSSAAQDSDPDCESTAGCRLRGECMAKNGRCVPGTNHQCRASQECASNGFCTLGGSMTIPSCVISGDVDCGDSSVCRYRGLCTATAGNCRAHKESDCSQSVLCKQLGECSPRGGICVAAADFECRKSKGCAQEGLCFSNGSKCIAKSLSDCKRSKFCTTQQRCALRGDRCLK